MSICAFFSLHCETIILVVVIAYLWYYSGSFPFIQENFFYNAKLAGLIPNK